MAMYSTLFQLFLKRLDPERAHHLAMPVIRAAGVLGPLARGFTAPDPQLQVRALGMTFRSRRRFRQECRGRARLRGAWVRSC
jgi:dihydroorotate dehydrogenase